jgi:hypothetical protein
VLKKLGLGKPLSKTSSGQAFGEEREKLEGKVIRSLLILHFF